MKNIEYFAAILRVPNTLIAFSPTSTKRGWGSSIVFPFCCRTKTETQLFGPALFWKFLPSVSLNVQMEG